jgi:hypothetical protein
MMNPESNKYLLVVLDKADSDHYLESGEFDPPTRIRRGNYEIGCEEMAEFESGLQPD